MPISKPFSALFKEDVGAAGGKGASLGEMTQVGIPVPPGFVVLAETFDRFLAETDLFQEVDAILHAVNHKEIHTVEDASAKIQALIKSANMPEDIAADIRTQFETLGAEFVAVRSSATAEDSASAAWAGQLDSFLNTTKETLLQNVQNCWASLFTPRAIFYRFEQGLHGQHISVAVVIQKMVTSDASGIAFSVHPVTEDYNQLIIEAGFGLGEAIVSGQVTPDSYVVEKEPRRIIDVNVNTQARALYRAANGGNEWRDLDANIGGSQVLSEMQIQELSDLVLRIEQHYGFPCDIEWALEGDTLYIVQSRPITTLKPKEDVRTQSFIKAYTRNFSIIMQQAWFAANDVNALALFGIKEHPHAPPYAYFMKEGVEEVWENQQASAWFLEKLLQKVKEEKDFFPQVYERYFKRLKEVESWWKKDIATIEELKTFIQYVYEGVADFVVLYGILLTENAPEEYKKQADAFREKDVFFAECNTTIERALHTIYPELGRLVIYITQEELDQPIQKAELEKRERGFALIPGIYQGAVSFDALMKRFPEYRFQIEKGEWDGESLKGQTAQRGLATGTVRIVKRKDQAERVQEGEIIVSPMTTPDFVPAMKKAAAFVTDEGGITCHAAIIAREMNKPCIIGTKVATQVLKDGDEVEVNADNGIVRILNRAGEDGQSRLTLPNPSNYQRMFRGAAEEFFLVADIFMRYYRRLDVLVTYDSEHVFMSWIPKAVVKRTEEEGHVLFSDLKKFKEFVEGIETCKERIRSAQEAYLKKIDVTKEDTQQLLGLYTEYFSYYSKTEFFFVDKAARQMEEDETLRRNLNELEQVKNGGREFLNDVVLVEDSMLRQAVKKLARQFKMTVEDLYVHTVEELLELFDGQNVPQVTLKQRRETYALFAHRETYKILLGSDADKIIQQFDATQQRTVHEVHGTTAHSGKKKGSVFIVPPDLQEIFKNIKAFTERMPQGAILVAETTSPELLPLCHKASAIITNQGGLLSHAAIVSREMNIPCIVATDYATEVLKDGDEVEVNADNGIVRILKRAGEGGQETNSIIVKLKETPLQKDWEGPISLFHCSFASQGYFKSMEKVFGAAFPFIYLTFENGVAAGFLPTDAYRSLGERFAQRAQDNKALEEWCRAFKESANVVLQILDASPKELLMKAEKLKEVYNVYTAYQVAAKTAANFLPAQDAESIMEQLEDARKYSERLFSVAEEKMQEVLKLLQKEYPVYSAQQLSALLFDDLQAYQKSHKALPTPETLDDRFTHSGSYWSGEGLIFLTGAEAEAIRQHHLTKVGSELKGTTAYGGKIRGRCRVIRDYKKAEITEGDILVTGMTDPNFVPLMKKAGAIVTDGGGVLCHAAIVSRELKTPCVIGTMVATQILKDGDEVEVDADNGKVTILKRAE